MLLGVVGFYQRAISPVLPPRCRFAPTCSSYAVEAIEVHGAGRGSWLAVRRLAKCAPWHPGGVDLVPPRRPAAGTTHSADPGTAGPAHSSCTPAPPPASFPSGAGPRGRAPRPVPGRTPPLEAGVA